MITPSNLKVVIRRRERMSRAKSSNLRDKFKVQYYIEGKQSGKAWSGSLFFKHPPRLSSVLQFICHELNNNVHVSHSISK